MIETQSCRQSGASLQHKQNQIFSLRALMAMNSGAGSRSLCPTQRSWLPFCHCLLRCLCKSAPRNTFFLNWVSSQDREYQSHNLALRQVKSVVRPETAGCWALAGPEPELAAAASGRATRGSPFPILAVLVCAHLCVYTMTILNRASIFLIYVVKLVSQAKWFRF